MLNSILQKTPRKKAYNDTQVKIIKVATKMFLQKGFTNTTMRGIAAEAGVAVGNVVYYFHSKDDLFYLLVQELVDLHENIIESMFEETSDTLLAYCMEVTAQIALCEADARAKNLYYWAYVTPDTMDLIRDWSWKKNYEVFHDRLPHWSEKDFERVEIVASNIELAALMKPCDDSFTIEDKITLILDSLMRLYDVEKDEREEKIQKILSMDYKHKGIDIFEKFIATAE